MLRALKDKTKYWHPSTDLTALKKRAQLYQKIRHFFAERNVLEVETPLLSQYGVTDAHLENIVVSYPPHKTQPLAFLQTSPEYAMKRLLAFYHQPIYQICKAFRHDEQGQRHNPEFTLLEWYRPGFDHHTLMDEMDALLQYLLGCPPAQRFRYQDLFQQYCNINPFTCDLATCLNLLAAQHIELSTAASTIDKDSALQLLMSHCIEPHLGFTTPAFIFDYPSTQAALAKISADNPLTAERFEVYIHGIEIANGFHELTDAEEQYLRFNHDQQYREQHHLPQRDIDPRFIGALQHGLPDCAGVAMGLDRLLMLLCHKQHINQVISFCWGNA